ncbi:hypothetical protein ACNQGP_06140 [Flavobacterium sp. GT2N3]
MSYHCHDILTKKYDHNFEKKNFAESSREQIELLEMHKDGRMVAEY